MRLVLGRLYVHHSSSSADLDVAGRVAHLALQPVVGILPKRRIGPRRRGRAGTASGRSSVTWIYVVGVCQSQKSVARPNGGNWFHPTICFFGSMLGGTNSLAVPGMRGMTFRKQKVDSSIDAGAALPVHTPSIVFTHLFAQPTLFHACEVAPCRAIKILPLTVSLH